MWKLSNNETPTSISEHFQIRNITSGEKKLYKYHVPYAKSDLLKKTLYLKGQGYGTLLKQNLKIKNVPPPSKIHFKGPLEIINNNIKDFYFHLTPFD